MRKESLLTQRIISAAIEVHRYLGPGLLESTYENCLCREFSNRDIAFERQVPLPVVYKGLKLDCGYRLDFLVENEVVVELKAVTQLEKIHEAQLLTYLRLTGKKLGLLLNFNVLLMKHGIKRMANGV
jgi:GxxExxY protein